jgi:hypothetical protein
VKVGVERLATSNGRRTLARASGSTLKVLVVKNVSHSGNDRRMGTVMTWLARMLSGV